MTERLHSQGGNEAKGKFLQAAKKFLRYQMALSSAHFFRRRKTYWSTWERGMESWRGMSLSETPEHNRSRTCRSLGDARVLSVQEILDLNQGSQGCP